MDYNLILIIIATWLLLYAVYKEGKEEAKRAFERGYKKGLNEHVVKMCSKD